MQDTIARYLAAIPDSQMRRFVQIVINALADRYASCMLGSAGIVIKAAGNIDAKTGASATIAIAGNTMLNIPAATNLVTYVGTTLQNTFNVYVWYVDNTGTISSAMGTAATTLAGVVWPNTPPGKAIVGGFTVNPTAANFVGGTTLLDAANTNVVYFSPQGAFDPSIFVGNF